jgi:hypothetical protein
VSPANIIAKQHPLVSAPKKAKKLSAMGSVRNSLMIVLSLAYLKLFVVVAHTRHVFKLTIANERTDLATHIILLKVESHMRLMSNA